MRTNILALFLILPGMHPILYWIIYDVKQWAFCRCPLIGWGSSRLLPVCWVFLPWKVVGFCQKHAVQSLSHVWLFATPQTVACQASLSFTISWILLKLMSIESVMPSNYLVLCHPLLLLPSIFPSIRVFSNESSYSVRPHRQQPTRLLHPWDSPGKNTGVGCHSLLQCMKGKSESEVAQSCPTLRDPMDCSPPGSSVHGIFQARVLEWGAMAFSRSFTYLILKWAASDIMFL